MCHLHRNGDKGSLSRGGRRVRSVADPRSILLLLRTCLHREGAGPQLPMEGRAQTHPAGGCRVNPPEKRREQQALGAERGGVRGQERIAELSLAPRHTGAGMLRLTNHLELRSPFAATAAASGTLLPLGAWDRDPAAAARSNVSRNRLESCPGRANTRAAECSSAEAARAPCRCQEHSASLVVRERQELGERQGAANENDHCTSPPRTESLTPAACLSAAVPAGAGWAGAVQGQAPAATVASGSSWQAAGSLSPCCQRRLLQTLVSMPTVSSKLLLQGQHQQQSHVPRPQEGASPSLC